MRKRIKKIYSKSSGFTLVELIVVIAILGLLATIGLSSFRTSQIKGRDSQRKNDLAQIQRALELYYNDHQQYPLSGEFPGGGGIWEDDEGTLYMKEVPEDLKFDGYPYDSTDGSYYKIYARLENENDPAINPDGYSGIVCGDDDCNYGVSSENAIL